MNYVLLTNGSLAGFPYKQGIYRNELTACDRPYNILH